MMVADPTFTEFISVSGLLGDDFAGPSWIPWKVTAKGMLGEPMTLAEVERFRELAGRDPPPSRVREGWFAIGRRAGKDSIIAALATWMAVYGGFAQYLRRGERAVVACIAVTRDQAGIVFSYIRANLLETPALAGFVNRVTDNTIELVNDVDIVVLTGNYRSLRGRTVACAVFDEISYWRDEAFANPDVETYRALLPGLTTLRQAGAMIIGISTVYRKAGLLYEKITKHLGQSDPNVLAILQPSVIYNPLLASDPLLVAEIEEQRTADPEGAAADWDSVWRSDLADFVDRQAVEACIVRDCYELPPQSGLNYVAFIDTSGAGADSMALAISHRDRKSGRAVLDLVREIRPPFNPPVATAEFAGVLYSYHCTIVTGDHYGGAWPPAEFARHGIKYRVSDRVKSELYLALLPLVNGGQVELLDNQRLFHQLIRLERRTGRGNNRDVVDHPRGHHDDLINAAAGALTLTGVGKRGPMPISSEVLRMSERIHRPPYPLLDGSTSSSPSGSWQYQQDLGSAVDPYARAAHRQMFGWRHRGY